MLQIARVLWSKPKFAVLDEATDAVSQEVEVKYFSFFLLFFSNLSN